MYIHIIYRYTYMITDDFSGWHPSEPSLKVEPPRWSWSAAAGCGRSCHFAPQSFVCLARFAVAGAVAQKALRGRCRRRCLFLGLLVEPKMNRSSSQPVNQLLWGFCHPFRPGITILVIGHFEESSKDRDLKLGDNWSRWMSRNLLCGPEIDPNLLVKAETS